MCGIAGRFNFLSNAPVDADTVGQMCDLLAHRGPDGDGVWCDGAIGLGHRLLVANDRLDQLDVLFGFTSKTIREPIDCRARGAATTYCAHHLDVASRVQLG